MATKKITDASFQSDVLGADKPVGGPGGFDEVLAMVEAAAPGIVDWARTR